MALKTDSELLDGGRKLPLVEDFYTIQGEGFHAGKPAYFIRLGGCDVGCRWCDAKYTWNPRLYPPTDVRTVIDRATACPAQAIVITGGEPLLYPLGVLTETLHAKGLEIFLRPVKITDETMLKDFFYDLSEDSMYMRFFSARKDMPHKRLQDFVVVDWSRKMEILAVIKEKERERESTDSFSFLKHFLDVKITRVLFLFFFRLFRIKSHFHK